MILFMENSTNISPPSSVLRSIPHKLITRNFEFLGMKSESSRSVELVWLRWVVPYDSIIEHVVALIVKVATIVEQEWHERRNLAHLRNPSPDYVQGQHFVPDNNLVIMVQLLDNWSVPLDIDSLGWLAHGNLLRYVISVVWIVRQS